MQTKGITQFSSTCYLTTDLANDFEALGIDLGHGLQDILGPKLPSERYCHLCFTFHFVPAKCFVAKCWHSLERLWKELVAVHLGT